MVTTCPECGAIQTEAMTCQTAFDTFLILEFSDPAYGAVHFLTVGCFMLQHGRYSDEGIKWMYGTLREYLEKELTPTQLRQLAAKDTSSQTRTWKVVRAKDAPPAPKIAWSMTIMDVATQYTDADSYRALITEWGRVTMREMSALMT
jgi:hypothetical protein